MDSRVFDRLVANAARRPSRRAALRLLAGGFVGGVFTLTGRGARAQRLDSDGDGLFDDDETGVYGTDLFVYDTDGDGSGDGEEIYYGTNPLVNDITVSGDGQVGASGDPGPGGTIGGGDSGEATAGDFGSGAASGNGGVPIGDVDASGGTGIGVADVVCVAVGAYCDYDSQCCGGGASVHCCFDSVTLRTRCEDTSARGGFCLEG